MMKNRINGLRLILLFIQIPFQLSARTISKDIDRKNLIRPKDTAQANIFLGRAELFSDSSVFDSAICYFEKASSIYSNAKIWDKYIRCQNGVFTEIREKHTGIDLMPMALEKLKIAQKKLGKNHILIGDCYNHIGNLYDDRDNVDSAIFFFEKAVHSWKSSAGDKSTKVGHGYINLGIAYNAKGDFETAREYCEKAIVIFEETEGPNYIGLPKLYNTLGVMYYYSGKFNECLANMEKSLEISKMHFGNNHPAISDCYNNLGATHAAMGEYNEALEYYYKSLQIRLEKLPETHPNIALSYNNIANMYDALGRYKEAEEYHQKALTMRLKIWGTNHSDIAMSYTNLGILYVEQCKFDEAIIYLKKALDINERLYGFYHLDVASSYNNMGVVYVERGDYDSALVYFKTAMQIREHLGTNRLVIAESCNNVGAIYKYKGNYDLALAYYQKGLAIIKEELGEDQFEATDLFNNAGEIYLLKGDYETALFYFQKRLEIEKTFLGENHPDIASCYLNIGSAYHEFQDLENEEKSYKLGIEAIMNSVGEDHPLTALLYVNLGMNLSDSKQTTEAIALIKKGIVIQEEKYRGKHPDLASAYNYLAEIFLTINEYDSANFYLQKSIQANRKNIVGDVNPSELFQMFDELEYLKTQASIAKLFFKQYKHSGEVTIANKSLIAYMDVTRTASDIRQYYNLEDSKITLLQNLSNIYPDAIDIAYQVYKTSKNNDDLNTIYRFAEESKSAALLDAIRQTEISHWVSIPDSIRNREKKLKNELTALKTQLLVYLEEDDETDSLQEQQIIDRYNTTRINYENVLEEIKSQYPSYMQLVSQDIFPLDEIINALDEKTAMLHYTLNDTQLFVFVITDKGCNILLQTMEINLSETITNYIKGLTKNRKEDYFLYNPILFSHLIQPALPYIQDKHKLVLIPDKELLYLPFESLSYPLENEIQTEEFNTLHYLVNDFEIAYQYSSSLWLLSKKKSEKTEKDKNNDIKQFIGYAPVFACNTYDVNKLLTSDQYKNDTLYRSVRINDRYFGDLPHTETEIKEIMKLFNNYGKDAQGRFFEEASEKNFDTEAREYKFLHVATHGLINDEHPELSGLLLYTSDSPSLKISSSVQNDSLAEMMITNSVDGILYSKEVYNMELNADLIVLSACETGAGKLSEGEGIMSLSRGFLYAGVPNIIFSFWKVGDKSTSDMMVHFYTSVLAGKSYSAALREAKINLIMNKTTCYPGIWSGFSLIGR